MASRQNKPRTRKAVAWPDLFERARDQDLLTIPAVRTVARRAGVGPALALALAELAGFIQER